MQLGIDDSDSHLGKEGVTRLRIDTSVNKYSISISRLLLFELSWHTKLVKIQLLFLFDSSLPGLRLLCFLPFVAYFIQFQSLKFACTGGFSPH